MYSIAQGYLSLIILTLKLLTVAGFLNESVAFVVYECCRKTNHLYRNYKIRIVEFSTGVFPIGIEYLFDSTAKF